MRTRVYILKLSQQAAQLLVVDALVSARIETSWGDAPDLLKTALAHFVKVEVPKEPDLSRVFFAIELTQRPNAMTGASATQGQSNNKFVDEIIIFFFKKVCGWNIF